MQISYFLLPKEQVAYITSSISMMEAMEDLERHHYTAIPIIDEEGKYVGTLSEGDLLWKLKNSFNLDFEAMRDIPISQLQRRVHNESVEITANMEDMLTLAADQNFVPVVDSMGIFLGIIRRKDIIAYYTDNITD
ncbi:CBS domain-containing protein [Paenibacillus bovis]|uniref:Inosine-5-monophosphate dehydrogenase n=1 Tax=Paenibacillus bovis TaxID=1616788 RepID=A0A172ZIC2_9BACL|nr:CBS domain-containing protein [Paenibacillus bovis]ANF97283.1 inosine-5-monophosphate dehydrogenase [Paenibacillus bovis]